jgi:hypothetical protein
LRKMVLYVTIGTVVGLFIMLVPIISLAEFQTQNHFLSRSTFSDDLRRLDGSFGLNASVPSFSDLGILVASFAVATFVYFLVKRKLPARDREWTRLPP